MKPGPTRLGKMMFHVFLPWVRSCATLEGNQWWSSSPNDQFFHPKQSKQRAANRYGFVLASPVVVYVMKCCLCLLHFGLLQMSDVSRIFPGNMSHLRLIRLKEVFPFLSKLVSSVKVQSGAISCCWCHSTLSCFICWMSWRRGSSLNEKI